MSIFAGWSTASPNPGSKLIQWPAKYRIVITSGGVCRGDFDVVKEVLSRIEGFEFWEIAAQPGKPFALGEIRGARVFGLPDNPVAAVVGYEQLVGPALLHCMGARRIFRARVLGTIGEDVSTTPQKVHSFA